MRLFFAVALAAVFVGVAPAAPPSLELPAEVVPVNGYARLTPKTDAVSIVYVALDGAFPFPSEELKNPRAFVLPAAGLATGRYRFVAVAAGKGGEQSQGEFVVVVGGGGKLPDPKPKDPVTPPGKAKYYFVVVRPDGPASPAFTKIMADSAWAQLRIWDHTVKDKTQTEAKLLNINVPTAQLPAVVTLLVSEDGKSSTVVRPAVSLPTAGVDILKLPEGVP